MDALDEQMPPPREACPTSAAADSVVDIAAAGGSVTVLVVVLCAVFAAAFVLEKLVRGVVSCSSPSAAAAAAAASKAGAGVPVQARHGPASTPPPPHPSEARLSESNAKVAAEVGRALEQATAAAAESSESEDDEGPVDVDELRQQAARRLSPDLPPATNPCSPHKRVTGGLRGFTSSKPLHFEAVFDRATMRDPTDFWLAEFALTHREEFERLVAETETEAPAFVEEEQEPLDRLRSDVASLKRSLARMGQQQQQRKPPLEGARVAPTPVKQPMASKLLAAGASPPVSPVLKLEDELAQQSRLKLPGSGSAAPTAAVRALC